MSKDSEKKQPSPLDLAYTQVLDALEAATHKGSVEWSEANNQAFTAFIGGTGTVRLTKTRAEFFNPDGDSVYAIESRDLGALYKLVKSLHMDAPALAGDMLAALKELL